MAANPDVLNSWKEVAVYLGRGVRTVQRWERDLNLPVRRPRGTERSAVIALKPELDHWLQQSPAEILKRPSSPVIFKNEHPGRTTLALTSRTHELVLKSNLLCERSRELCLQMNHSVRQSIQLMSKKEANCTRELGQQINQSVSTGIHLMAKEAGNSNVL